MPFIIINTDHGRRRRRRWGCDRLRPQHAPFANPGTEPRNEVEGSAESEHGSARIWSMNESYGGYPSGGTLLLRRRRRRLQSRLCAIFMSLDRLFTFYHVRSPQL